MTIYLCIISIFNTRLKDDYKKYANTKNNIKHRVTWGFNPVTRTIPSKKVYSRKKLHMNKYEF